MIATNSLWHYFAHAGMVVKIVMLILFAASILSWTIILQRSVLLSKANKAIKAFEDKFWSGADLTRLYQELMHKPQLQQGLAAIFTAGFKEFLRGAKNPIDTTVIYEASQRAMRIAESRELDQLEHHLPLLATIGSVSPYVGLFGTVWGIMTAFQALGQIQGSLSISMVAPGISEALIATAMGLFAAIPAVVAYNRFSHQIERLNNNYSTFQEELTAVLQRQNLSH
jgi:biopolymer transport protein TolQ